jgi:hypothetical protein
MNWQSLLAFLDVATQWRTQIAPSGAIVWFGLDYVALDIVLRRRRAGDDVFDDVMEMERAALKVLSEAVA